jgi:hypothetical protein
VIIPTNVIATTCKKLKSYKLQAVTIISIASNNATVKPSFIGYKNILIPVMINPLDQTKT